MTPWNRPLHRVAALLASSLLAASGCGGANHVDSERGGSSSVAGATAQPGSGGAAAQAGAGDEHSGGRGEPALGGAPTSGGVNSGGSGAPLGGDTVGGAAGEPGMNAQGGSGQLPDDACNGVTALGQCSANVALRCITPTGNGTPTLVEQSCRTFEHCVLDDQGARCVVNASACLPGTSECQGSTLRECVEDATWQTQACAGDCQTSVAGAFCVPGVKTQSYTGTLQYEAYGPKPDLTDWSDDSEYLPAQGVLVLSFHADEVLDAALVESDGHFTLNVASAPASGDQLAFLLMHPAAGGASADFAVFDPAVPTGTVSVDRVSSASVWHWSAPLVDYPAGSTIKISEQAGSGAVHVYNHLRAGREFVTKTYGSSARSVVAWMHLNTEWDCGACFAPIATELQSLQFDSQLFFSATAQDRSYWSPAVTVHEFGHFTMYSYGVSPDEGGSHCIGVATAPGQAWSEGWATGFSSIARDTGVYFDKQEGSMFWIDLDHREYPDGAFVRPKASRGLMQDIDENEVAAMLWKLAKGSVGASTVLAGLQTVQVTQAPFARGYTRREWDVNGQCQRIDEVDTGENVPMFADYLDGLRCNGTSAAEIDAVTNPNTAYPYPSGSPLCNR